MTNEPTNQKRLFEDNDRPKKIATVFKQENAIARIQLKLISPEDQLQKLMRVLPNGSITGQVLNSQTLNYKTLKPEKNGLFCERTFGPIEDFVCACGKRQKTKSLLYCPDCEVEYTSSRVRRYRLGFIRLGVPMVHVWYLKGRPSYISFLLDMKKKHAESLAYGQTCLFNNYSPEFGQRVQRLRFDFDTRFAKMRRQVNQQPGFFGLRYGVVDPDNDVNIAADYKTLAIHLLKRHADDFWIHPTDEHGPYKAFHFCWTKTDYLRKKPFFQLPLVRDRFNIPYRGSLTNLTSSRTLEKIEEYLFMEAREYGSTPLPKYAKAVPNSMICYEKSWNIELLLSGGLAFNHLFSKIDCYRMQVALYKHLARTRHSILWLKMIRRRFGLTKKEAKSLKLAILKMAKTARRMKLYRTFWRTGSRPEWMFISILPILPPDLRPIIKMSNDQLAVSDLNRLYQAVFHRNRNLKLTITQIYAFLGIDFIKLANDPIALATNYQILRFSTSIICFQQNLLQESIDALLENGKSGAEPICGSNDRPLKSLSDILKGKKGRFRQNLLGKRVDYSGRSVIVVGPKLKLYQCGLPKELALELFQSLLIRKMMTLKVVKSMIGAKQLIRLQHPIIWPLLNEIMDKSPIFLNRAPTLHRLGVQAFLPKLVRGKAILLHPLVCPAFNADFDGDQMGVHVPLSIEAKSESWSLMLSSQNVLSPATGDPILTPSQDMVLGCYYLTTLNGKFMQKDNRYFSDLEDVYKAYINKQLHAHDFIWLRWPKNYYSDQPGQKVLEVRIKRYKNKLRESMFITSNSHKTFRIPEYIPQKDQPTTLINVEGHKKDQFIRTTVGRVILNQEFQRQIYGSPTRYANYVQSY